MAVYLTDAELISQHSKGMSKDDKMLYMNEYNGAKKSDTVNLLLVLFFGFLGIHKFYMGNAGMGVLYLLTCGIFGFGALWDLFTFKAAVFNHNKDLAVKLAVKYRSQD
jgi:TctA family transporter